ncbi:hypothetical protein BT96DRAFT_992304 [Gymnopus androsaceus JB14]|uniref:Uncharacterized protein n=1 Tax=Gymnopus androsaceus JB14 TaxID=1447944 RepID=A0A6A4HS88_9AGAR|nr:hypothetical protein BT96DRAFT_992304 [Gymnopus androsaceus JB14]
MVNIIGETFAGSLEFPGWKIPQTGEFFISYFNEDVDTPGMTAMVTCGEQRQNPKPSSTGSSSNLIVISTTYWSLTILNQEGPHEGVEEDGEDTIETGVACSRVMAKREKVDSGKQSR